MPTLNLKKVFSTCRKKFCSINGALVGRLLDESMRQERAMLAQAETKSKAPLGNCNGRPDKSDGLDLQFAKLKKEVTLAQREISNLKNNYTKPRRTSRRNVLSAVPRARRIIPLTRRLAARGSANKLSKPRHRGRELHHRVRQGRVSRYFRLETTVTRRWKMIIQNRMQKQHMQR